MSDPTEEVRRLVAERARAREGGDFAAADALRDRLRALGFDVADGPHGPVLSPRSAPEGAAPPPVEPARRPEDVESLLDRPPRCDASVQWVVQGWAEDVVRGIRSFRAHQGSASVQHVVVDTVGDETVVWPEDLDVVRLVPEAGWAYARNTGLRRSDGRLVVLVDGSIEATGDWYPAIARSLSDPSVGLTGPFGIVTEDLREFRESPGPLVDAVEAYLMAIRRDLVEQGLRFDEKFRFYRSADIEFSFQVKAMGLRASVTPVPLLRHDHRMWTNTPDDVRSRLSKRNFYRFLDRWRGRRDLTVAAQTSGREGTPG